MGAFGELLIKSWGGDIDSYQGNTPHRPDVKPVEEIPEEQKEKFRYHRETSYARNHLNRLTNKIMYDNSAADDITEAVFREGYARINTKSSIVDLLWNEYQQFLIKYIKK